MRLKPKELRKLNKSELKEKLGELRSEILKERSNLGGGSFPKNPGRIKQLKRDIARVLTVLNEKRKT